MNDNKRGNFLLALRLKYNLKQKELSSLINYSDKAISKWERGLCFPNDPKVIIDLANLFEVSVEEILNGEFNDNNVNKNVNSFFSYILFFRNFIFKYKLLFSLLIIFICSFFIYYVKFNNNLFSINNNFKSDLIESYDYDNMFDDYNLKYSKFFDIDFVKNNNIYYKKSDDNIFIFYNVLTDYFNVIMYFDDSHYYRLSSICNNDVILVELFDGVNYKDFILNFKETKNCDIERCISYEDYAMYINYLKENLKE